MNYDRFKELYDKYNEDEFLRFDKVENKLSNCNQMHAFMLLDRLMGSTENIIASAEHDIIYLSTNTEILATLISEEQILELCRSGVSFDSGNDSLYMFV